uniref:Putative ubiquitin-like protein n=1 Tax=Culex tarsalis TaxID=7177 RepID=A0A1Q3FB22_CULTA
MLPFFEESDEFTSTWTFGILALIVVYFAWRSTYVREDRPNSQGAVLVIEDNLRRLNRIPQPVNIHILRSSSQQSNISNVTETEELDLENDSIASSIDNITQSILTEASESATGLDISDSETTYPSTSSVTAVAGSVGRRSLDEVDHGPEDIIRQMDQDLDQQQQQQQGSSGTDGGLRQRVKPASDAAKVAATGSDVGKPKETPQSRQIRIKLKYLNDDSKLVEGNLNEGVGEFKKRNFTIELAAKKLVRLVFNGHVLQPDDKTLAACGLFDNCVVHCLIHTPKPVGPAGDGAASLDGTGSDAAGGGYGASHAHGLDGVGASVRDNGTRYGTYFIYIGTFILSATITYCWYCRFHYGHLFNLNSTIGLIVTTTIFLIMMPTIILTDSNSAN